ncbi:Alpha-N-acetylgalactosaminidase [Oceanobacillus oncorhynchi]|uniref:Alpha-N-acetylgalactosaminidase n=1 Tax=Oceanobacillus oncorhynchi TaxID=545501 RepID=A0A0A1MDB0_9BACI|nr:Gfo/Idh/MocA family oxidoreductase [Oceanobacillus oncorhynchi]CEI83315.1 Alpha-N-acetylgalactosaminidase [Oceanobacillus oncorhynchi]
MNKLKIGIVGTTRGADFYKDFNLFNNVEVKAIMDTDKEALMKFSEKYGVNKTFSNYEEFLNDGIDVVVLTSPIHMHARQAISALNKDIHVLSEVTAATTLEECKLLLDAVKRSKAKYMMAENYCYIRENVAIQNMVKKGLFGEIYYSEGAYIHNVKHLQYDENGDPTWRKTDTMGKRGCNYGTHSLGPILNWFNESVQYVNCLGSGSHTSPDNEIDDTTIMLCRTESDALIKIRLDLTSNRPHIMRYYSLQGTKGCYEAPSVPGEKHRVWLKDYNPSSEEWMDLEAFYPEFLPEDYLKMPVEPKNANHWGADYYMIKDFLDCIMHDKPLNIDIYKALQLTLPGILSEESITSDGKQVTMPDISKW